MANFGKSKHKIVSNYACLILEQEVGELIHQMTHFY